MFRNPLTLLLSLASFSFATKFSSLHLFMQCVSFWNDVRSAGHSSLEFDTDTCLEDENLVLDVINTLGQYVADGKRPLLIGNLQPQYEEYYRLALEEGVSIFTIEDGLNATNYNVTPDETLHLHFEPDMDLGAWEIGEEFCRVAGGSHQNFVLLYAPLQSLDRRVDGALEQFQISCPDSSFTVKHSVRGGWDSDSGYTLMTKIFLMDSTITSILAALDQLAIGAIQAADEIYSSAKAKKLYVSGWDYSTEGQIYLERKRIIGNIDQLMNRPTQGLWDKITRVKQMIEENPRLNSTTSILTSWGLDSNLVNTEVLLMPSDGEGYVTEYLQKTYSDTVRAVPVSGTGSTQVSIMLYDVNVDDIDISSGNFDTTFWVKLEWTDARLIWDSSQYNGTLEWETTDIWFPNIYFPNIQTSESQNSIFSTRATINSEGLVRASMKITGSFACKMVIQPYPFDYHHCDINIAVASTPDQVSLADGSKGVLNEINNPEGFITVHDYTSVGTCDSDASPTGFPNYVFEFHCTFTRDPFFVISVYILFAWVLNVVAFGQFWMSADSGYDRCGLAITTTLTLSVLKFDATISKIPTWIEMFFSVNLCFQITAFVTSLAVALHPFDRDAAIEKLGDRVIAWTFPNVMMLAFEFIWGGETVAPADRIARRIQVPCFLLINMILPFYPRSGDMSVAGHPDSGVNNYLFKFNAFSASLYAFITISYLLTRKKVRIKHPKSKSELTTGVVEEATPQENDLWPLSLPKKRDDHRLIESRSSK